MPIEITLWTPQKIKGLYCKARKWCVKEQKQNFRSRKIPNGCVRAKKSSVPEKPFVNQIQVTRAGHLVTISREMLC